MSSLMQHDGELSADRRRVVLKMCLVAKEKDRPWREVDVETFLCVRCHGRHAVLYKVPRRPVGMLGCWVQFRWNGEIHAPDLSVPIGVETLPKDAKRMEEPEMVEYWHSP